MVVVERLTKASEETLRDLNGLLTELRGESKSAARMTELQQILEDPNATIVVAQDNGKIVGLGILFIYQKLGKKKGWVEDVIVSETYRGQGLGTKIMEKIIEVGKTSSLTSLQLTSRLQRTAAHALYEKLGFEKYDTFVYRLKL